MPTEQPEGLTTMTQQPNTPATVEKAAPGITNDDIRREFLAAGFTIKDLRPHVYEAARRILALAAQQAAQPVAGELPPPRGWLLRWPKPGGGHSWLWQDGPDEPNHAPFPRVPLYTAAPAPVGLVPLTETQIAAGLTKLRPSPTGRSAAVFWFTNGVSFAEAAHGIKAGKDVAK